MNSMAWIKVASVVVTLAAGVAGGAAALTLAKLPQRDRWFALGNALAGGIFLGAGLIHMLPDAQEGLGAVAWLEGFPWAIVILAVGFLSILFVEKVLVGDHHDAVAGREHVDGPRGPGYLLAVVLSIHAGIAGVALGSESKMAMAMVVLVAILAHKATAAFALALSLIRSGTSRRQVWRIVVLFCCSTPLGIVFGAAVAALLTGTVGRLVTGVFDALAAGTFLYVALVDIVEEEFRRREARRLKYGLLVGGTALMAVLAVWV